MTDLKVLRIGCPIGEELKRNFGCIRALQFKTLTPFVFFPSPYHIEAVDTDGSGHTSEFSQFIWDGLNFHPPRHFGAGVVTTLHLDQSLRRFDVPASYEFLRSVNAVRLLEFDGTITGYSQNILSVTGVFSGLKVIQGIVSQLDCERTLQLVVALKWCMMKGKPLTMMKPLLTEGEDGLERSLRVQWEDCYKVGIRCFLSYLNSYRFGLNLMECI